MNKQSTPASQETPDTSYPSRKKGGDVAGEIMAPWRIRGFQVSLSSFGGAAVSATLVALVALFLTLAILLAEGHSIMFSPEGARPVSPSEESSGVAGGPSTLPVGSRPFADGATGNALIPFASSCTVINKSGIRSERAVLVDAKAGEVVASLHGDEKMYPASMTKVMTLIVVAENLPEAGNLNEQLVISQEVYDYMKSEGASGIGLDVGEQLTVEALLHMLILRSDGIAACELARYIAGSETEFVAMMNRKAESMGLTNTHFANPTGLHDENNYSTCRDIASIMNYAMNMSLCRRILTAAAYEAPCTALTGKNQGKTFTYKVYNNLLVTMLNDKYPNERPKSMTVIAGKTGYTGQVSGYCLVSYAVTADDHAYVCVTSQSGAYLDSIRDYITIYDQYAG